MTFATHVLLFYCLQELSAGENPKVVSERLGHASIVLTLDTYSHVLPDMQKGATEKMEDYYPMERTVNDNCCTIVALKRIWKPLPAPKPLLFMVRLAGIEPAAHGLGIRCSIP